MMLNSVHDIRDFGSFVSAEAPRAPDLQLVRWLVRQRRRNAGQLPWHRARFAYEMVRRGVYARQPIQGNMLEMLLDGRLSIGRGTMLEATVTIRGNEGARIHLGKGVGMNRNAAIGAGHLVVIGDGTLIGQGTYITDVNHAFGADDATVEEQGFSTKGPTIVEDNVWMGANVVVTSGVRVGRRSVIGANTVVTRDVPPYSMVRGASSRAYPIARPGDERMGATS
jgi:acetyltransferase-like isoleucine patch superfamily enzyme